MKTWKITVMYRECSEEFILEKEDFNDINFNQEFVVIDGNDGIIVLNMRHVLSIGISEHDTTEEKDDE